MTFCPLTISVPKKLKDALVEEAKEYKIHTSLYIRLILEGRNSAIDRVGLYLMKRDLLDEKWLKEWRKKHGR